MRYSLEKPPAATLFHFVVNHAVRESNRNRILIYRAAAEVMENLSPYREQLIELADQLEQIERASNQLKLEFEKSNLL